MEGSFVLVLENQYQILESKFFLLSTLVLKPAVISENKE